MSISTPRHLAAVAALREIIRRQQNRINQLEYELDDAIHGRHPRQDRSVLVAAGSVTS